MTESDENLAASPQNDDTTSLADDLIEVQAPQQTAATAATARFRPMSMPSAPFWLVLIATIVGVLVVLASWSVIFMFGIGIALAFVLLPIVNWLTRHGFGRTSASGIVVLVMVVIVALLLLGFLAILINQGIPFVLAIPGYLDQIHQQIVALDLPSWIESTIADISDAVDKAVAAVNPASVLLGFLQGAIGFVGTVLSLLVVPFFMFFFMRDQPKIAATFFNGVPVPWRVHIEYVIHVFKDDFADYFKAEVIVGSIMGVIIAAGTFILGSLIPGAEALREFALFLGLIAGCAGATADDRTDPVDDPGAADRADHLALRILHRPGLLPGRLPGRELDPGPAHRGQGHLLRPGDRALPDCAGLRAGRHPGCHPGAPGRRHRARHLHPLLP